MANLFKEFLLAGAILTRLPVFGYAKLENVNPSRSVKFFGLIGLIIGIISAGFLYLFHSFNLPSLLMSTLVVFISIIITGGLHEDGLADCCDSFGALGDKTKKLEIMRDSNIGTYGVIGLIFSILFRILLIYYLILIDINLALAAIIIISITARVNLSIIMFLLEPIRNDGLAFEASNVKSRDVIFGISIIIISFIILIEPSFFIDVFIVNLLIILLFKVWAKYYIGGYSGDILGAGEQFFEVMLYFAFIVFHTGKQSMVI